MGYSFNFLLFLGMIALLACILKNHHVRIDDFVNKLNYECWFLITSKSSHLEALRDADRKEHYYLLQRFKRTKPFSKKRLLKKLVAVSASTSELTAFHFALFELLADFDQLTISQGLLLLHKYEHLPESEQDTLMDILSWYQMPATVVAVA